MKGSFARRCVLLLCVGLLTATAPGCDFFNSLWGSSSNGCPDMGYGGDEGAGGDDGAGGGLDYGAGGDPGGTDVGGVGVGGADVGVGESSSSADVGAGAGPSSDVGAGAGPDMHRVPPYLRWPRRPRRGGSRIGTAVQADCPQSPAPTPAPPIKPVPLTTYRLRAIAGGQSVGAGLTGIQLNRAYGKVFETWVLNMGDLLPRWNSPLLSPQRQAKNNGGLPASVIPESIRDLQMIIAGTTEVIPLPLSKFWEVKAVNGKLMPSTSQWQMLGLIDVATQSKAGKSTLPHHPPPVVELVITGNTIVDPSLLAEATQQKVAIWVQVVFEDPLIENDPDPVLYLGAQYPMNPSVYTYAVPIPTPPTGKGSKLLSPTVLVPPVPGDPDPPEVDP